RRGRLAGVAKTTIGPLDKCGVWSVAPAGPDGKLGTDTPPVLEIACNLASRPESDLRPPETLEAKPDEALTTGVFGKPVWFYLLAVAWVLTAVEWYLYQRRWVSLGRWTFDRN